MIGSASGGTFYAAQLAVLAGSDLGDGIILRSSMLLLLVRSYGNVN